MDQGSLLSVPSQPQVSQQPSLCPHLFLKPVPFPQLPPTRVWREGKAERLSCCRLGPLLPPGMTRNQSTSSASSRLCPNTQTTIQKPSQVCKGGRNTTQALNCWSPSSHSSQANSCRGKSLSYTQSPVGQPPPLKHSATSMAAGLLAHSG